MLLPPGVSWVGEVSLPNVDMLNPILFFSRESMGLFNEFIEQNIKSFTS
jgi:hypothetical protein